MIPDEKVKDREFGNLLAIPENYPKKVVSIDEIGGGSYQGIEHVSLEEFLLSVWPSARVEVVVDHYQMGTGGTTYRRLLVDENG